MDLGAGICTPRSPACAICPVMADCRARGRADIERLPVKPAKKAKPQRHGVAHWIERDGCIWLVRRPEKGMRAEEHTSELQSLMRRSDAVFCLNNKNNTHRKTYIRLYEQSKNKRMNSTQHEDQT